MISKILKEQVEHVKTINLEIGRIFDEDNKQSEQEKNADFLKLLKQYPGNIIVVKNYLLFLQLLNDETLLVQYELEDISNVYDELVDEYKDDIDLRIEKVHFDYAVMDEEDSALRDLMKIRSDVTNRMDEADHYFMEFKGDPNIYIGELEAIIEELNLSKGRSARIWSYNASLSRYVIRIFTYGDEVVLHLAGLGSTSIKGPISWENADIKIERFEKDGEAVYRIYDEQAGFELLTEGGCGLVKGNVRTIEKQNV